MTAAVIVFGVLFATYVLVVMPWLLDTFEDEWPWRKIDRGRTDPATEATEHNASSTPSP